MIYRILVAALLIAPACLLGFSAEGPAIEWEVFDSRNGLAEDGYLHVFEDVNGNIWLATLGAVATFDGTKWRNFRKEDGLVSKLIMNFFADSYGHVWFFNEVGKISKYDGRRLIEGAKISARLAFEDNKKNIWVPSSAIVGKTAGILRFENPDKFPDDFVKFTKKQDGLAGNFVNVMFEDSNHTIWIGTNEGISAYDGNGWTTYDKSNGFTSKNVTAIVEDSHGNVWFGSHGGLFRYDGRNVQRFTKEEGTLPTDDVLLLKADNGGNVWVGLGGDSNWGGLVSALSDLGHKSGVLKFDGQDWVAFRGEGDSPPVKIIQMEIDSQDNVWCDSYTSGIYLYDGKTWTKLSKDNGFYANHFYDFEEDSQGNIWLATGSGLLFFDGQDWTQYSPGNGLFAENVFRVIEDSRGDIWITTGKGVGRYRRQLQSVAGITTSQQ